MSQKIVTVDSETVSNTVYDVVIVGAGIAGAIVAKQLSEQGKRVLILEASTSEGLTLEGFQGYVERFYGSVVKHGNSPYPLNANALSPTDDVIRYFEEKGPLPLSGSYTRVFGGTTMHWEGKTLRMLPEDFKLKTNYGHGLDWPITDQDLWKYYRQAEYEIGVSGNTAEQRQLGITFEYDDYVFPMKELPPSYLDKKVREKIQGTTVDFHGETRELGLSTFPQGRNSIPNSDYKTYNDGYDFVPDGVASKVPVEYGERCQGNANCVPICPVQAKYDARKTLNTIAFGDRVHLLAQTVASEVEIDPQTGRVTAIHYKHYQDRSIPSYTVGTARGKLFVLATNAVENAKLMLASHLPSTSGLMGRNLMDHPFVLAWALMPQVTGTMRGPLVTSGIASFRRGDFRKEQCAFGIDIHNDGWGWSGTGATDIVRDAVDNHKKYGSELRQELISRISRQLLLAFMCELPADPSNRVSIDPHYKDQIGNYRPVIHFNIPDYCKKTIAYCRELSKTIFQRLGAEDHTHYDKSDPAYFEYEGEGYWFRGGNHFSGTHVMGTTKYNSVVNAQQRSWDHENLYLVGAGSMPSIGTSNTTLSIAALAFLASEQMLKDLNA
ncbi:dehydrogenase subunit [Rippkaea orientalis PCC 8801]|uniref:Dehydrogenase subunit n=1 Tax=Rippkaea orientalis (strain PCC 8801 / RF-1) TaxID=41431 RepID=B7JXC9_RIPO1|nr:GMC family oxidoreductase [Rippkaea orientalis]ACK67117.1 dehydrogenase subunit [Rippkaea orientalis PCC 8801]